KFPIGPNPITLCIVMPLYEHQTLEDWITDNRIRDLTDAYAEFLAHYIFTHIAKGVDFLHSRAKVVHGDIKVILIYVDPLRWFKLKLIWWSVFVFGLISHPIYSSRVNPLNWSLGILLLDTCNATDLNYIKVQ